jgi:RNA polymerase sigma factor (sigma-70 family)
MERPQTAAQAMVSSPPEAQPSAPTGFEELFRTWFRELVRTAMYFGATKQQAEDAAAATFTEMLPHWTTGKLSLAWARRAVLHNFIKDKTRGPHRVALRLVERGHVAHQEGTEDSQLTVWEDGEWVAHVLSCLPPAQREVMECVVRGLDHDEIAKLLGKTSEAVRRNLCDARARLADELHLDRAREQLPRRTARSPREEG